MNRILQLEFIKYSLCKTFLIVIVEITFKKLFHNRMGPFIVLLITILIFYYDNDLSRSYTGKYFHFLP